MDEQNLPPLPTPNNQPAPANRRKQRNPKRAPLGHTFTIPENNLPSSSVHTSPPPTTTTESLPSTSLSFIPTPPPTTQSKSKQPENNLTSAPPSFAVIPTPPPTTTDDDDVVAESSPPPPPPRPLPVGCRLIPSDNEFVTLTEMAIEGADLQHDVIKENNAYLQHPSVLIDSGKPANELWQQHVFKGTRKKGVGNTFSCVVGHIGYWKQAGSRAVIKNENGNEVGWKVNFDLYEYLEGDGEDSEGEHTHFKMTEYISVKYPFSEVCVYTLVYCDDEYKSKSEGLQKAIDLFGKEEKKDTVVNKNKKKGKAIMQVVRVDEGETSGCVTRSQRSKQVFVPDTKLRGLPSTRAMQAMIAAEVKKILEASKTTTIELGDGSGVGAAAEEEKEEGEGQVREDKKTHVIDLDSD